MKGNFQKLFIVGKRMLLLLMALAFSPRLHAEVDEAHQLGIYLAQHGYGAVHVDISGNNNETIDAELNGKKTVLIVDTGCTNTCLTAKWARHLKLDVQETKYFDVGVGGVAKGHTGMALLNSFKINN